VLLSGGIERLRSSVAIWRRRAIELKMRAVAVTAPRVNVTPSWMRVELWCSQLDIVREDGWWVLSEVHCILTGKRASFRCGRAEYIDLKTSVRKL
jgi:hypothetical protein